MRPRSPSTWPRSKVEGGAEPRRAHAAVLTAATQAPLTTISSSTMALIDPGKKAPAFSLPDQDGQEALARRLRRPAGRSLLLSEGRHAGLHQGIVRVPGQPAEVQEEQGGGARHQRARRREQGEVRRQVRPQLPAARRRRSRGRWRSTACGRRSRCTARSTWASRARRT